MPFQYPILDRTKREIRLIRVWPRNQEEINSPVAIIRCSIECASLDDSPPYTALSYTWGDPANTKPILVDGVTLQVTENLEAALRELLPERGEDSLAIWIDAISINQKDDVEKSWQVQMMRTIYENAQLVLVWLGPAADDSDIAVEKLEIFGKAASRYPVVANLETKFYLWMWLSARYPADAPTPDGPTLEQIFANMTVHDSIGATIPFTATRTLLRRPWWQRVWVLQELAVAKKVVFACGTKRIAVEYLAAALTVFRLFMLAMFGMLHTAPDDAMPPQLDIRPYIMLSFRLSPKDTRLPLLLILRQTCDYTSSARRLCASDPRDFIYAMLGICADAEELGIVPDYSKSCNVVYTEIAKIFIKRYSSDLLATCFFPKCRGDLPSWVLDWSASSQGRRLAIGTGEDGEGIEFGPDKIISIVRPSFSVSKGLAAPPIPCDDPEELGELPLYGTRVDTIHSTLSNETIQRFVRGYDAIGQSDGISHDIINPSNSYEPNTSKLKESVQHGHEATDGGLAPSRPSQTSPNRFERNPAANPYIARGNIEASAWAPIAELGMNFLAALRELACSAGNIYGNAESREDAVWRTPIADSDCLGKDEWFRPAKMLHLFQILYARWSEETSEIEGLTELAANARIHRAHGILTSWGFFPDLDIETVRQMNRPMILAFKSGPELAKAAFREGLLKDFGPRSEEEAEEALAANILVESELFTRITRYLTAAFRIDESDRAELIAGTYAYLRYIRLQLLGRTLFVTSKGYLGLGPAHLQAGDVVAIFQNTDVPFTLRPRSDGRFEFIGETYLHGIMDGEFIEKNPDTEIFRLY